MLTSGLAGWLLGQGGAWGLVLARVAGMAWTAPTWGTPGLDWRLRLLLSALLTATLVPIVGPGLSMPIGVMGLGLACLGEAAVGAALGFSAALIVAGARQAGEIVGAQAGLSAASLFDPEAGDELTPFGHLYALVALATFLALDGPLILVEALIESYRVAPVGGLPLSIETANQAFGQVGQALELTLRLAAPTAVALAVAGVALGLLARAAPALQLVSLTLPARSAIGVVLVLIGLAALAATLAAVWGGWPAIGWRIPDS